MKNNVIIGLALCAAMSCASLTALAAEDNIFYGKSVCQNGHIRISVISEQRRQISGMVGMLAAVGVEMPVSVGKCVRRIAGTAAAAVNVKSKNTGIAPIRIRKPVNLRRNKHAVCAL